MALDLGAGSTTVMGFGEKDYASVSAMALGSAGPMGEAARRAYAESFLESAYDAKNIQIQPVETPFPHTLEIRWTLGKSTALAEMLAKLTGQESPRGLSLLTMASSEVVMVSTVNDKGAQASEILATYVPAAGVEVGAPDEDSETGIGPLLMAYLKAHAAAFFLLPMVIGLVNRFGDARKLNPWLATTLAMGALLALLMVSIIWQSRDDLGRALNLFSSGAFWTPVAVVTLAPMLLYFSMGRRWSKRNC